MWVGRKSQARHQACQKKRQRHTMPKTKPYTVSKTKTYAMPKTKVNHEWRTQHVTCGIDFGLSFFLLLLSSLTMERIIISMLSVWMIPKSNTTAHLLWEEKHNLSLFQPGGRRGKWQAGKVTNAKRGFLIFFQISNTTLFHLHWLHLIRVEVKDQCTVKPKTG